MSQVDQISDVSSKYFSHPLPAVSPCFTTVLLQMTQLIARSHGPTMQKIASMTKKFAQNNSCSTLLNRLILAFFSLFSLFHIYKSIAVEQIRATPRVQSVPLGSQESLEAQSLGSPNRSTAFNGVSASTCCCKPQENLFVTTLKNACHKFLDNLQSG